MIYYEKQNIRARDARKEDIDQLVNKLRKTDIEQFWNTHHLGPLEALRFAFENSTFCASLELDGEVIAVCGMSPDTIIGNNASIWLIATDRISEIKLSFLRLCHFFISKMQESYSNLYNFVDAKNLRYIKWLETCGAKVHPENVDYGEEQEPFCFFTFGVN